MYTVNKILQPLSFALILLCTAPGLIKPQSIKNIEVTQEDDTVNIKYNIISERDFVSFKISLLVSADGGRTFGIRPKNISGDIGYGIKPGPNKIIKWQPLSDSLELKKELSYVFKVVGEVFGESRTVEFVSVPGGSFVLGDQFKEGDPDERKTRLVTIDDFEISPYEVTNLQYADFLNKYGSIYVKSGSFAGEKMINEAKISLNKKSVITIVNVAAAAYTTEEWETVRGEEYTPVTGVTWFGANEFCLFNNGRLPFEAEWEYAAREKGAKVRYGNGKDSALISEINFSVEKDTARAEKHKDHKYYVKKVASNAPNSLGLFDMSGNVWEWCHDWYVNDYTLPRKSINPTGPIFGKYKVIRGGSCYNNAQEVRACKRSFAYLHYSNNDLGFRIARSKYINR